jgi:hypothetical protein
LRIAAASRKLKSGKSIGTGVGPRCIDLGKEAAIHGVRARQHARHFEEAGDRQPLEIANETGAGLAQPLAPEPPDDRRGSDPPDLPYQRAGVHVTGRLAARDHHA